MNKFPFLKKSLPYILVFIISFSIFWIAAELKNPKCAGAICVPMINPDPTKGAYTNTTHAYFNDNNFHTVTVRCDRPGTIMRTMCSGSWGDIDNSGESWMVRPDPGDRLGCQAIIERPRERSRVPLSVTAYCLSN